MDTGQVITIALIVLVGAAAMWAIFLFRMGRPGRRRVTLGIPHALRPGQPDEVLEGPRLERLQAGGLVAVVALAIFIPVYWLGEVQRQDAFAKRFEEQAVARGKLIFSVAPPLDPNISPQKFKQEEQAIALGMGCANCHGSPDATGDIPAAAGGVVKPNWKDPVSGETVEYHAPPLYNVFQRWDSEVVEFTIERGRPGTPMPTWGVAYGGPMTTQMVSDVIAWLQSLPGNQGAPEPLPKSCDDPTGKNKLACGQAVFTARCAVCHGPQGQGKEQPGVYYQGMALWKGDVRHLNKTQHLTTIRNGRRFAYMPQWAETPTQGIPVPPSPLTDAQIEAVMTYERQKL
jgi:cytochrome c553